ncbi:MAG: SDR family oxidoreductase, partial [Acidimicrobiales bacterium]|nr:SDR family oxidoreductase [Acidimicrobiales bacterium]
SDRPLGCGCPISGQHNGGSNRVKPAPFVYHRPTTAAEAAGLLAEHGDEAKPIAGGQSLVPILAMRLGMVGHLVDLNHVEELAGIERSNGHVRIGAMTRQRSAERNDTVATDVPLLAEALPWIGHFQIRNRGTIGGSIAHADPASELPAVALALDAELDVLSASGARTVAATDFFEGTFTTAIADGELLTAVRFPVWGPGSGFAVREFARRSGDFAVAGAVAGIQVDGGMVTKAAVALLGMGSTPVRASAAEAGLTGVAVVEVDPTDIFSREAAEAEPLDDIRRTLDLNLVAPFLLAQAVQPHMVDVGRGAVVNIASIGGIVGVPGIPQASYAAAKAGLSGLTVELAVQWAAHSIRVNAVAPGFFRSEITDSLYDDEKGRAWLARNTPLPGDGSVDDVVGAVLWLVSDAGRYVTGQTVVVDGGWTAR